MNENNDIWVNGEDLKYEYAYFSVNAITGKKNLESISKSSYLTSLTSDYHGLI